VLARFDPFVPTGRAAVLLAAVVWSTGGLAIKALPLSGLAIVGARALVTVAFYALVCRPDLRRARLSSALPYAAMLLTYVTATKLTTAANAIVLQYSGTAWLIVLTPWFLREPLRRGDLLAALACLGGVGLCALDVGAPEGPLRETAALGNALALASGIFYAFAVLAMRRDLQEGREVASTTLGNLLAALVALPLAATPLGDFLHGPVVGGLLWLGVVQIGIAYLLFQRGMRTVSAATAALLVLIEPVLSPLWAWWGTGEAPGPWTLAGGGVVVGVLAAREWRGMRSAANTTT
jgi:DME family drug/metabolite transporter